LHTPKRKPKNRFNLTQYPLAHSCRNPTLEKANEEVRYRIRRILHRTHAC
jgi:hypothetical protein